MNIDKYLDVINACRFCFMCRHLSTNGLATGRDSDTARGHALIADLVRMNPETIKNPDYAQLIYESDLSGACRKHCFGYHEAASTPCYDETGLQLALRRDFVEAGNVPAKVAELAKDFQDVNFTVDGDSTDVFFLHPCLIKNTPAIADAFKKLAPTTATIQGGDCGAALYTLGYEQEAKTVADKFVAALQKANCKKLIIPHPADYNYAKNNFDGKGFEILTSAEYLAALPNLPQKTGKVIYIKSDFLTNYQNLDAPRKLLVKAGYQVTDFGTNPEESYACGEGSMVQRLIAPEITRQLVQRTATQAKRYYDGMTIVAVAPYTNYVMGLFAPEVKVISVEEALA